MIQMIPELLDKSIRENPNGIAIREKNSTHSYEELADEIQKTAKFLQNLGIQKGDYVGLYMELSTEYVIAILAILKIGGVFIPISPKTPEKRLQDILNITQPKILLTQNLQKVPATVSHTAEIIDISKRNEHAAFNNNSLSDETVAIDENDPAYVFFTSGSTGEPKAILGRSSGLAHFISWEIETFEIHKNMIIGAMTPIMFDPSLRDILVPLCAGATLTIPDQEMLDFSERLQWLIAEKVTLIHAVPSIYEKLHDEIRQTETNPETLSLRYILFAGEKLYADAVNEWMQNLTENITIANLYGPSETTLAKFCHIVQSEDIKRGGIISLGKSLPETKLYLLGEDLNEVNHGEIGEIVIETSYRSLGYLQEAMNADVFIKLPTSNQIAYKTGDLGYLDAAGNLMYSGRKDFQIKINGVRIEINEIEAAILKHEAVKKVTVLYNEEEGGNLIAYVQFHNNHTNVNLKTFVKEHLAPNLWPAHYITVDTFPLNANGKIDRKTLKESYQLPKVEAFHESPTTPTQERIHHIWKEVLKKETIGIHDNFFEIGGHSLNALVIISKLHKAFETRFEIESFFTYPTIYEQATQLFASENEETAITKNEIETIPAVENSEGIYIASNGQKRMFIHSSVVNDASIYNITGSYVLDEVPSIEILQKSLEKLVERHETLRTIFFEEKGEVYQKIIKVSEANPTLLQYESSNEAETTKLLQNEFTYAFELEKEPAIHVGLIQQPNGKATIFYCMHHIISDGWSLEIFINDLLAIYKSLQQGTQVALPPLRIQYKDYATHERNNVEKLKASKQFWNKQLSGEITTLDFPTSYKRPVKQTFSGASLNANIPEETVHELKNFCKANKTTYFSGLMAILYTLLYKYSGQQDIIVGVPAANRDHEDLHPQIGLFVNTLVIREKIKPEIKFTEFVGSIKQTMLEAFTHKNYPYDQLVEDLGIQRDLSRNPLFDVMVNFQTDNKQISEDSISEWNATELGIMEMRSKFDFSFYFYDLENTTNVLLIYNTNLFTEDFAKDLLKHFMQLVDFITQQPETTLQQAQYLSDQERAKIITGFNNSPSYPTTEHTLQVLVEKVFQNYANRTAITTNTKSYTFEEIDTVSNKLANALLEKGVSSGDKIIVNTKRDQWFLASVTACIKIGAVYIPLDEETPELLKNAIARENKCKVTIDSDFIEKFEKESTEFSAKAPKNTDHAQTQTTILYTTGSTGKPKGVLINQKNIINRLEWMWNAYPFQKNEVSSFKTSISFVDHIWEVFGPFLKGIPLVCFDKTEQVNIPKFIAKLEAHAVSRIVLVPSLLQQMLAYLNENNKALPKLTYWTCSGEVLSQKLIHDFYTIFDSNEVKLLNIYGSTEVTADATCFDTSTLFTTQKEEANLELFETSIEDEIEALIHDFDTHEKIVHYLENNEYVSAFDTKATTTDASIAAYVEYLKKHVLPGVINIAQTKFIGHMTGPLPSFVRSMSNLVTRLNQNLVKIETSGVATRIETDVILQIHRKIFNQPDTFYKNYDYVTDGILGGFTNGGTLSNITALYYAMNNCFPATSDFEGYAKEGLLASLKYYDCERVVILGSRFCHYSFEKALKLFGLGKNAFELLELDHKTPEEIEKYIKEKVLELRSQKVMILSLVGIAGTTETGEVEPIQTLGEAAEKLHIHFHVDAAFGGAYLFSEKNEHLLNGIAKADSITICHHKQFYTPIGTSMYVLKTSNIALNSEFNSRYQARKGSYDLGKFSIEGTRNFNSLIVHGLLTVFGTKALGQVIDHNHQMTTRFSKLITQHEDFELYQEPTMNIVLYRYIPVNFRGKQHTAEDIISINEFNTELQQKQFKNGNSFVSYTTVKFKNTDAVFFRTVLLNPYTTEAHLKSVLQEQIAIAYALEAGKFGTRDLPLLAYDTAIPTIAKEGSIIGKPISNVKIYILDQDLQLVPVGVQGMIYVAGKNITEGYANDKELTQQKFIINPFNPDEIIYSTGDYAKWTADGNIVYLGRTDNQYKIRGNRVNTLYLEKVISEMPEIKEAVIKFDTDSMIAFMTLKAETLKVETVQKYLNERLPKYMLPSSYILLEKFPRNTSGKIDRKQLVSSLGVAMRSGDTQVLPKNETEEKVLVIWEQLFEKRLSVKDDFFLIGGHSLNLMKLIIQYSQTFGVELQMDKLFLQRTIVEHALLIKEASANATQQKQIQKTNEENGYPLSYGQERLIALSQIKEANVAYNMHYEVLLEDSVDFTIFTAAIQSVVKHHEILRTVFRENDSGEVRQWVLPVNEIDFTIQYIDFTKEKEAAEKIRNYISEDVKKPFDLANSPLFRIAILKAEKYSILYYNMHHIISDAWSLNILYSDIMTSYHALEQKATVNLPELHIQYKDYAAWQRNQIETNAFADDITYWKKQLQNSIPKLTLPYEKKRPLIRTHNGQRLRTILSKEITSKIRSFCSSNDGTVFMGLVTGVNILLTRYTNETDIVIGSPVAGRNHPDLQHQIGFYVNTITLRNHVDLQKNFTESFHGFRENTLQVYKHQTLPFNILLEALDIKRDMSRNALFDMIISYHDNREWGIDIAYENNEETITNLGAAPSKFDVEWVFHEENDHITFDIVYNTDLHSEKIIRRLMQNYVTFLTNALETQLKSVGNIPILTTAAQKQLLEKLNHTDVTFPETETVVSIFQKQTQRNPEATAVVYENTSLTYRELDEKTNQLARYLMAQGISKGKFVPIYIERSLDMIISILAIAKAGAAYVPIDIGYPQTRIQFMLKDIQAELLLTQEKFTDKFEINSIAVDTIALGDYAKTALDVSFNPNQTLYSIYTSGTTGTPKGVLIPHKNVVRLLFNEKPLFDFSEKDVWTMFHSYAFDFSVWEMYGALLHGGKLILVPETHTKDAVKYSNLLIEQGVTVVNKTPSAFYVLQDTLLKKEAVHSIRYVIFGGEALQPAKIADWAAKYPTCKLINMYGITETTIHNTYKEIGEKEITNNTSVIGTPIPTLEIILLDNQQNIVPKGVIGELYIAGVGVADGYLNRKALTETRFVTLNVVAKETKKYYKTGDLAYLNEDDELVYVSRKDNQVKIRGYRIEIGEIETALHQIPELHEVKVLAIKDEAEESQLVAFYQADEKLSKEMLLKYLKQHLPLYMIPSYFQKITAFPLTVNGKIDTKQLRDNFSVNSLEFERTKTFAAPRDENDTEVLAIWKHILGIENISIDDNLFELGGNSLKLIRILNEINTKFNVELELITLIQDFSIRNISDKITEIQWYTSSDEINSDNEEEPNEETEFFSI